MSGDPVDRLVDVVRAHYDAPEPKPLLLSRFGQLHGELRQELVDRYGTLSAAIEAVGPEHLIILRPAGEGKGGEIVAPSDRREAVEGLIAKRASHVVGAQQSLQSLPMSMQIAFCARTEPDQRIVLQLAAPFRYSKLPAISPVPPGSVVIDDRYRRPDIDLRRATASQKQALWAAISNWAIANSIELESLMRDPARGNALARLLAAQPRSILPQLVIPGDILELLLKHD